MKERRRPRPRRLPLLERPCQQLLHSTQVPHLNRRSRNNSNHGSKLVLRDGSRSHASSWSVAALKLYMTRVSKGVSPCLARSSMTCTACWKIKLLQKPREARQCQE